MLRTRRQLKSKLFCANTSNSLKKAGDKKKVHDLKNKTGRCQIESIIKAGHANFYETLNQAIKDGYEKCSWCFK